MRWRMIGPFRGGRTVAASGIPGNTNVFYAAANNGGVWKTTDAGRVWAPVFDEQPTGSIGVLAVAPSRPNTLYVGSGEGLQRPDCDSRTAGLDRPHSRNHFRKETHLRNSQAGPERGHELPARIGTRSRPPWPDHAQGNQQGHLH